MEVLGLAGLACGFVEGCRQLRAANNRQIMINQLVIASKNLEGLTGGWSRWMTKNQLAVSIEQEQSLSLKQQPVASDLRWGSLGLHDWVASAEELPSLTGGIPLNLAIATHLDAKRI